MTIKLYISDGMSIASSGNGSYIYFTCMNPLIHILGCNVALDSHNLLNYRAEYDACQMYGNLTIPCLAD